MKSLKKVSRGLAAASLLAALGAATTAGAQVDVSDPAGTHATISAAITAANPGATITVDGSTYNGTFETVIVNKAGIVLQGINGATVQNAGDGTSAGTAVAGLAVVRVTAANVTVQDLNVVVDEPEAAGGIVFTGASAAALGDVTILNNTVTTTGPSTTSATTPGLTPFGNAGYGSSVGISVHVTAGGATAPCVVQGNSVGSEANPFSLGGIWLERAHGQVGGLTMGEGNSAYCENFAFINRFTTGDILIQGNEFSGWGDERNRGNLVELGDVQTGGQANFQGNTVTMLAGRSPQGFIPRRALGAKNIYNSREVEIFDNIFNVRKDQTVGATEGASGIGVALTNVRRAFLRGNTFNALNDGCLLVEVNNKIYSSGQTFANIPQNRPRIYGNTFDDGGNADVTAIEFRNHSQENGAGSGTVIVEDIVVGNPSDPNVFSAGLANFIVLSDLTGPTSGFLHIYGNQAGEAALSVSTAAPFTSHFFASENMFDVGSGPQFPFQMDGAGLTAVEAKVTDYKDNAALGFVVISRTPDVDNDDVPDAFEMVLGTFGTPSRDFDNDGVEDGVEIQIGTDPAVFDAHVDTDGDGLPDAFDPTQLVGGGVRPNDFDGDGFADFYEVLFGSDPENPAQTPLLGDVDNTVPGVDFTDGIRMLRVFLGLETLTALDNPALFDVNRDGVNDNVDGVITINYFLGNITVLPFGS